MILPFLSGILSFRKAPMMWMLVLLNALAFALTLSSVSGREKVLESLYSDDTFVASQGLMFARFIVLHPETYSEFLQTLAHKTIGGSREKREFLARLAIRDLLFMGQPKDIPYEGDQVQLAYWRTKFLAYREESSADVYDRFGLSISDITPYRWISYQFVHGSLMHLLSNMWFLIIFGGAIEVAMGSTLFFGFYLLSGILAAAGFVAVSGMISTPLVGASGSVSGLMGLYILLNWKRPTRFLYWILPLKGYFGILLLPTWVALIIWSITDFVGYFGTLTELGGVAHAAHLSGFIAGLLFGLLIVAGGKASSQSVLAETSGLHKA